MRQGLSKGSSISATFRKLTLAALMVSATAFGAAAQGYPTKPIDMITAFPAGGGGDGLARIIAKYLGAELGQRINVINRPGGNTIPAILSVMNARPDGYTVMFDGIATSSLQMGMTDLPYKVLDRTFGPRYATSPYFIAVNAQSPYKTLDDLAKAMKAKPGDFRIAWLGGTSLTDTILLSFLRVLDLKPTQVRLVPFPGSGPAATALAGGHIDVALGAVPAVQALYEGGTVRVLALAGEQRLPALPNVPSSKEAGYHIPLIGWNGLSAPPKFPKEMMDRIDQATQKISKDPAYIAELAQIASAPAYMSPADNRKAVEAESDILVQIRKDADLK